MLRKKKLFEDEKIKNRSNFCSKKETDLTVSQIS